MTKTVTDVNKTVTKTVSSAKKSVTKTVSSTTKTVKKVLKKLLGGLGASRSRASRRILDHLGKLPGEVSGGMKKRAGLARAMVTEPEIVFFDEPDSGLDPVRVAYLDDLVVTAQRETGATFFIITHNITSVMRVADYLGVLFRSKLVESARKSR